MYTVNVKEGKYNPNMSIRETEVAIKFIKDHFERVLAEKMNLTRVSAPLYLKPETGLNDDLNGIERPVSFDIKDADCEVEIVHSLAKWKRMALRRYGFNQGEGLYTDMNAIRRDEVLDNLHSVYVDQWDWEKVISKKERNISTLKEVVNKLFSVFKKVEYEAIEKYPFLDKYLPEEIFFITTQELEDLYPKLTPKERENRIAEEKKAVFLMKIGGELNSGIKHDGRAPDYDDWELNGDIIFWYPILNCAFEVSSMGIRVDEKALVNQIQQADCQHRLKMEFHQDIINKNLPYTIGGGIGQSRICMFYLGKAHIGEVQASIWTDDIKKECEDMNIPLL